MLMDSKLSSTGPRPFQGIKQHPVTGPVRLLELIYTMCDSYRTNNRHTPVPQCKHVDTLIALSFLHCEQGLYFNQSSWWLLFVTNVI